MSGNFCYPEYPLCDCDKSDATTLSQTKTAEGFCRKTYGWELEKSVDKDSWDLFKGDEAEVCYTLEATKDGGTTVYGVRGVITIVSGSVKCPVSISSISDKIFYKVGSTEVVVEDIILATNVLIAPGATYSLPYEILFTPVPGVTAYYNRAEFTIVNHAGQFPIVVKKTNNVSFSLPSECELVNDRVRLFDFKLDVNQEVFESGTVTKCKVFKCPDNGGSNQNFAYLFDTSGHVISEDNVIVTINCRELSVSKTAQTSFTREWEWDVSKTADLERFCLQQNQVQPVNYTVQINGVKADSDYLVSGDITIHNPSPNPAKIISIEDVVSSNGLMDPALVQCAPLCVAANSEEICHYSVSVQSTIYNLNTVIVKQQNYRYAVNKAPVEIGSTEYQATAVVDFGQAQITEVNKCVYYDDNGDNVSEEKLCAKSNEDYHKTIIYPRDFPAPECPETEYTFVNTATVSSLDHAELAKDIHSVTVCINCAGGCTLTIGYWKTHSKYGPARWPDETWLLIQPNGPDSFFFLSGQSWIQVAQTPPAGNSYYVLAYQYIAAKLNKLAGASSTAEVDACIVEAEYFFNKYTPAQANKLSPNNADRKKALACAVTLDNYNNGLIGPGHCFE